MLQIQDVMVQDVRGRYNANNQGRPFQRNNARGNVVAGNAGGQNRDGNVNPGQAKPVMCYNYKGIGHIARELCEDNEEEHVVQSNVSSVRNDALMSILDEMHEQGVQSRSANKQVKVVNDTVTSELARYKELVGEYEKRAKFELTDRERKIDEQMRIIISDRNRKETSLKSELHSAQILLSSTVGHYKSKTEEVTILKKDFKQKEDKFLEEFLDIKRLKEKNKVAIGYKNPLCLTRAKQVQPALYNGHVLVMSNHARPVVHDSEDTRDMAEITRKRMMEKMQSPL
ncbi:hypothetical protein Tco_1187503, partial [Tanacetum coccineum]